MWKKITRKGSSGTIQIDQNGQHQIDPQAEEQTKKQTSQIDNQCPYLYKCKILAYHIKYFNLYKWKQRTFMLFGETIQIGDRVVPMQFITKLKCYSSKAIADTKQIKIVTHDQDQADIFLAASTSVTQFGYPLHFNVFAKIINAKNTTKNYDLCPKFKAKVIHQSGNSVEDLQKQSYNVPEDKIFVKGLIYKKSKYEGNWQTRFIIINQEGIFSYKDPKSYSYKLVIKAKDIKELWTRFQFFNNCLIIKAFDSSRKYQFAIPLADFCCQSKKNWLYGFYRTMK